MVPDKAIDLVDELLRDLHLRELNLEELANRIERSCNFTLGLMLEEQQTLGRLRQLLTPYEWCVGLPRLIRKWDAVQRAADKARPELRPLVARLNQAFERDYLSADNAFASDCDAALLDEHSYDRLKTEFVRNWGEPRD